MNFYIGQRVVCVETHPEGFVIAGQQYTITGIHNQCKCGVCITVGFREPAVDYIGERVWCMDCGSALRAKTLEWTFFPQRFRPLDTLTETMERIEKEGCPLELEHA